MQRIETKNLIVTKRQKNYVINFPSLVTKNKAIKRAFI